MTRSSRQAGQPKDPLAIVGIGCRFPGGVVDVDGYWDLLVDGRSGIIEVPENRWNRDRFYHPNRSIPGRMVTKWGGFVDNLDKFDPQFWGISPREAVRMDPQQRWLLEVSWEAIEDAGLAPERLRGRQVGVFVGIAGNDYAGLQMPNWNGTDVHTNSGCTLSIASNRISYMFDFRGPSASVDTACSSALVAISQACHSIWSGECEAVLAGGVNAIITPHATIGFSKASMLSPSGQCNAFDEQADGYVRGEGAAMVLIKHLDAALQDGDPIYAVVRAAVVNQDGHTSSMTVPGIEGQSAMLRQTYRDAGMEPGRVVYVEAHGTGTPVGDPIEATALGNVLSDGRPDGQKCLIGSVKTNIGHLESGSGVAGLVKAALILHHDTVPPNLNFRTPNPNIPFERLHLEVADRLQPLPHQGGFAPVTAVNSFGFGGTNAHIVLEAAPQRISTRAQRRENRGNGKRTRRMGYDPDVEELADRPCLLPISARDDTSLRSYVQAFHDFLEPAAKVSKAGDGVDEDVEQRAALALRDICYSAGERKEHHANRLVVIGKGADQMREQMAGWLAARREAVGVIEGKATGDTGNIVFVFTGQGAQWWKMGRELYAREPLFRQTLDRLDGILKPLAGWSLVHEMMEPTSENKSKIHKTSIAQPVIFALQVGLAKLWKSWGIEPAKVIGHSVGEVAAAYLAGIYTLDDAVKIIFHRSRLQDTAFGDGRMLAVGISAAEARAVIGDLADHVQVAVINSPSLVTLAGDREPLEEIAGQLEHEGKFVRWLRINYAFHTHHMDPIKNELLEVLADINPQPSRIPYFSTVSGGVLPGEKLDAMYWWRNVRQPVLFAATLSNLVLAGERVFVELGPHPALESAINEILAEHRKQGAVLHSLKRETDESQQLLSNLAGLHTHGTATNWAAVNQTCGNFVRLPNYPWHYDSYWLESDQSGHERLDPIPHPLLGQRLSEEKPVWRFELDPRLFSYLNDHRIWDSIVFPGAGYGEIGLAVARELFPHESYVVEALEIKKALFVSEDNVPTVRVTFDETDKSYSVYSTTVQNVWELNARGRLTDLAPSEPASVDLAGLRQSLTEQIGHDAYYDDFAAAGYQFGPNFQHLQNVWRKHGEVLAEIVVPTEISETVDDYRIHPAVLDACLHVFRGVKIALNPKDNFFLPTHVRRIRLYLDQLPTRLWAHAKMIFDNEDTVVTDIWVYDDQGQRVADILGFRVDRMEQKRAGDDLDNCYFQYRWEPCRLRGSGLEGACEFPSAGEIVAAVGDVVAEVYQRHRLSDYYHQFVPRLEKIVHQFIQNAYVKLGWSSKPGDRFGFDEFVRQLGIVRQHHRLVKAELAALLDAGVLKPVGEDHWEVVKPPMVAEVDAELDALDREFPRLAPEVALQRTTGPRLAEVLSGRADPMELLFPDGSSKLLEAFYVQGLDFPAYNELIPLTVTAAVEALPARRALRMLEVGAGTGSLTSAILPVLPDDRSEYLFTDVSPTFLATAKKQFAEFPFVDYQTFDVEKDAQSQGVQPHSFDLILATNVLHATSDLKRTLSNLQTCLAPGGMLLFLEGVRRRATWDNVFGLLKGWWQYTDTELRPDSALLQRPQWETLLAECGFRDVQSFISSPDEQEAEQAVFVCFAPDSFVEDEAADQEPGAANTYLVFADQAGVADQLIAKLRERGDQAIAVRAGKGFNQRDAGDFTIAADSKDDLRRVFDEVALDSTPLAGVVHCWSLDHTDAFELTLGELQAAQQTGVLSAMRLVQVVADREFESPPRVHIVTRDVYNVAADDLGSHLASSPLVGLARVANNEHFQFRWTIVDLDREPASDEIEDLCDEIVIGDNELEVAYRGSRRYATRLHAVRSDELPKRTCNAVQSNGRTVPYRLQTEKPGILTNLSLNETRRRDPGPGEIEVRVKAGGINFRDIMKALGMYPGKPIDLLWFGDDFSGTVKRVGKGVIDIQVGDEVAGMAPYSFRAYSTVDRRMVFKTPAHLSFEDAATLPTVFLTSHYAINHLARLQPGEKILIHAGTGGVGQAAIQISRHLGLEIFATAGTPEKRRMLAEMGVPHAMSSRTLDFADQILEITRGEGVDAVLNSLAGEFIPKSVSVLAPFGRFLEIGKIDIYNNTRIGLEPLKDNISYFVIDLAQHLEKKPAFVASMFAELGERFEAGDYQPLPHKVFPITDVIEAFRYMAQGKHVGKNVLSFQVDEIEIGPCTEDEHLFRTDASYLIVGGAGGFGLALAKWMSQHGARNLVLMSRSGPPDETAALDMRQMQAEGVKVVDARGDVTRLEDVRNVLGDVQRDLPPVRGVIHGAMVLDDEFLVELNDERFNKVLHPKILGAWNLHVATRDLPLEHFICFSSFSSIVGGAKQANYNAGNFFLDALAHYRRALGFPALTFNWSALSGAGFVERNQKTAEYLDKLGMKALTMDEAFSIFRRMLARDPVQVAACPADWQSLARFSPLVANSNAFSGVVREQQGGAAGRSIKPRILAAATQDRPRLVEDFVAEQVAGVFGVEPAKVDRQTSLTKFGLDSLMAIDLINRIESELGMSLPMGNILRGPNVKELAEILLGLIGDAACGDFAEGADAGTTNTSLVPLEKTAQPEGEFPLSEGQQALWFLYRLAPNSSAYNLTFSARFTPRVDLEVMQQAFASLFQRHPMLDVTFSDADGRPVQRLRRNGTVDFREHDATHLNDKQLAGLLVEHANQPFDLENGPVVRLELFRTADSHVGLLCVHHIVSDAWSITVLIEDLTESYFSIKAGRSPQFEPQSFGYEDFVAWEQKHLDSAAGQQMGQFWRKHVEGAPQTIDLPTDRPRPPVQSFRGGTHGFKLDDELTYKLLQLAAVQNVTLFTLLLSAYEVLLHRYSNQDDFLVGCPMAGRQHRELQNVVGYFVNPVPLRSCVDDDPTFVDLLARNHNNVADALQHQQYPLKRLVNDLQVPRDTGRSPLFQVAFSMERMPGFDEHGIAVFLVGEGGHNFNLGELQMETIDLILRQSQFEILLVVEESGGNIFGCWQYSRDLFDAETIDRLNEMYADLLTQLVRNPSQRISQYALSSAKETGEAVDLPRQLAVWNQTDTEWPSELPIHQRIEQQAARTPDEIAVVCGSRRMTYGAMNERANQLAHYLRTLVVEPNTRVGICMRRDVDLVVAIQGVLKAGAAYVPLDPTYPQQRLETIAQSAGMSVVVSHDIHRERIGEQCGRLVCLDSDWDEIARHATENCQPLAKPDDLIYVIYTSGSTGQPKGAAVYHRGFANLVNWFLCEFEIDASDRSLVITSHGFDLTQKNLYAALTVGGQVHLSTGDEYDPDRILREIESGEITLLNCTPSNFYLLVSDPHPRRLPRLDSLRCVFLGGEPIEMAKLAAWRDREDFRTEVVNTYGPTECTDICSFYRVGPDSDETNIPVGRPIYNVRTYVLDECLAPVPVGVTGELCIAGAGIGAGYINDAEMTASKFVTDPFAASDAAVLYRTGDLCRYRAEGAIEFVGRKDNQVKIRGFRVELGEIENVLRQHPGVRDAVVLARADARHNKRLVAYLVLSQDDAPPAGEFKAFLRDRLPDHMVPSHYVTLEQLPLTPHGKVNRQALPALELKSESLVTKRYVTPRDEVEARLAKLWQQVLGIEQVGVSDGFFNLGGDSLLSVELVSTIRKQFGVEIPLAVLLQGDTVARMASYLRQRDPTTWSPLVPIQPHGERPPLFCIHPVGGNVLCYAELAGSLGDDQPVYGIQARGVDGSCEPSVSMDALADEYLRAVRSVQTSGPYYLAAWSSGGVIAHEMARRLEVEGHQVGMVALLDSFAPSLLQIDVHDEAAILVELVGFLNRFYQLGIEVTRDELCALDSGQRLRMVLERVQQTGFVPADIDEQYMRRFLRVCQANLQAIAAYAAKPCELPAVLFRASDPRGRSSVVAADRQSDLGWRSLIGDQLRIVDVPGDHVTMLTGERVRKLARLLHRHMTASEVARLTGSNSETEFKR